MEQSLSSTEKCAVMEKEDILKVLPHRSPFMFVDRITEQNGIETGHGEKLLTGDEYFYQDFGRGPELPKPIIMEIMAQAGAACILSTPENKGKIMLFAAMDNCTFGKAPVPGERLDLQMEMKSMRRGMGKVHTSCLVNGEVRADGVLMFALAENE